MSHSRTEDHQDNVDLSLLDNSFSLEDIYQPITNETIDQSILHYFEVLSYCNENEISELFGTGRIPIVDTSGYIFKTCGNLFQSISEDNHRNTLNALRSKSVSQIEKYKMNINMKFINFLICQPDEAEMEKIIKFCIYHLINKFDPTINLDGVRVFEHALRQHDECRIINLSNSNSMPNVKTKSKIPSSFRTVKDITESPLINLPVFRFREQIELSICLGKWRLFKVFAIFDRNPYPNIVNLNLLFQGGIYFEVLICLGFYPCRVTKYIQKFARMYQHRPNTANLARRLFLDFLDGFWYEYYLGRESESHKVIKICPTAAFDCNNFSRGLAEKNRFIEIEKLSQTLSGKFNLWSCLYTAIENNSIETIRVIMSKSDLFYEKAKAYAEIYQAEMSVMNEIEQFKKC